MCSTPRPNNGWCITAAQRQYSKLQIIYSVLVDICKQGISIELVLVLWIPAPAESSTIET